MSTQQQLDLELPLLLDSDGESHLNRKYSQSKEIYTKVPLGTKFLFEFYLVDRKIKLPKKLMFEGTNMFSLNFSIVRI